MKTTPNRKFIKFQKKTRTYLSGESFIRNKYYLINIEHVFTRKQNKLSHKNQMINWKKKKINSFPLLQLFSDDFFISF